MTGECWRPISEIDEDCGECVFVNVLDIDEFSVGSWSDWDFQNRAKIHGWTHFKRIILSHDDAMTLRAKLGKA